MENSFLVGLSQQMAANRSMEVIANNLANMATPAYKRESEQFQQYMTPVQGTEAEGGGTVNVAFVLDHGTVRDMSEGSLETTGSPLDIAISGPGYFVVKTPDGDRYTRDGHFRFDEQGRVVTEQGYAVQSDGGDISLQAQDGQLRVSGTGALSSDTQTLGKLKIVKFDDERALQKMGASLYDAAGQNPDAVDAPRVSQGMVEKSNVEPVLEISHMIEVMRAYQASADLTQSGEDLLKQAIEKLGAVPQS
jgi:flagellar basal-body rod protein FlgF